MTFILFSSLLSGITASAQMNEDKAKRPSPPVTASGTIGTVKVVVNYSAPSVKGRKVYGSLQKFGSVWRAGANEATTISFDKNVSIDGKSLPKGKYAFYVLLNNATKWTLIFNKKADQWGTEYENNKADDVLKTDVMAKTIPSREKLAYTITSDGITLAWETKEIHFKVAAR